MASFLHIATAPFRALRELYWFLDSDAKVRSVGYRTVGTINRTETETHTDQYGTTYTYHVTYDFAVDDFTFTHRKKVNSLNGLRRGEKIVVHYLPNFHPPRSAVHHPPVRLSERQIETEWASWASPRIIRERGKQAAGTVLRVHVQSRPGGDFVCRVRYEFVDGRGTKWTNTKWLREPPPLRRGSAVEVYYLENRPSKNTIVTL